MQTWIDYRKWECYLNGMYVPNFNYQESIIEVMKSPVVWGSYMKSVVIEWHNTCANHLSNPSINKQAFIGAASMCYAFGSTELTTRQIWKGLDIKTRQLSNLEADNAYKLWKSVYYNTFRSGKKDVMLMASQMKLNLI